MLQPLRRLMAAFLLRSQSCARPRAAHLGDQEAGDAARRDGPWRNLACAEGCGIGAHDGDRRSAFVRWARLDQIQHDLACPRQRLFI